jgi:hypothetical protein
LYYDTLAEIGLRETKRGQLCLFAFFKLITRRWDGRPHALLAYRGRQVMAIAADYSHSVGILIWRTARSEWM